MSRGQRPATTPHRCHICGDHIWLRGRLGWQHVHGRHNHPAHHHVATQATTQRDTAPGKAVA